MRRGGHGLFAPGGLCLSRCVDNCCCVESLQGYNQRVCTGPPRKQHCSLPFASPLKREGSTPPAREFSSPRQACVPFACVPFALLCSCCCAIPREAVRFKLRSHHCHQRVDYLLRSPLGHGSVDVVRDPEAYTSHEEARGHCIGVEESKHRCLVVCSKICPTRTGPRTKTKKTKYRVCVIFFYLVFRAPGGFRIFGFGFSCFQLCFHHGRVGSIKRKTYAFIVFHNVPPLCRTRGPSVSPWLDFCRSSAGHPSKST